MAFNTILGPTRISPGNSVTDPLIPAGITTLSDGSFAVTYELTEFVGTSNPAQIVSEVFNGQGQLVQETFAKPLPHLNQFEPDVAALSGGGYALAWTEQVFNASGTFTVFQVYTAVYDNAGHQLSAPVGVDVLPDLDNPQVPQVAALSNGGYVVTWLARDALQATDLEVAVYNSAGQQVVAPINVTNSPGVTDSANFIATSVAGLASDGFALTWTTSNSDFDRDVWTAVYDSAGNQVLAPVNLTHSTGIDETYPQIAVLSNGNYALTWDGVTDPAGFAVPRTYNAVFDAQGHQIAAPSVVGSGQISRIAALTNGDYAVMWSDGVDLFTAVYDGQGQRLVAPVTVSSAPGLFNFDSGGVTALANGAFALTWHAQIADGSFDIFTAVYDSQGHQLVAPVNVSNSPGVDDSVETVDARASANGSYAITWQGLGPGDVLPPEYMAIYQFVGNQSVGNVNVIGSPDINIDLGAIITVNGDVIISDNGNLVTLDLHNLLSVGGNFVISGNGALLTLTLPSLVTVGGNLDISGNTSATVVDASSLTTVSGDLDISGNASAGVINVGGLTTVGGDLDISGNTDAGVINAGALTTVGGDLDITGNTSATVIDASSLTTVSGDLDISGNTDAGVINAGALTTVGGDLDISGNASAGVINAGALTTVGGDLDISGNTGAGVINAGSLTTVGGDLDLSGNTSVITIDLGALVQAGAIIIANNGVVALNLAALVNVGGDVSISDNHSLLTVDMPELAHVTGNFRIAGNTAATTIGLGNLTTVTGSVSLDDNSATGSVDLGSLTSAGSVDISNNSSATTIGLGSLTTVSGSVSVDNNTATGSVDLGSLESAGGAVSIGGNKAAGSVDLGSLTSAGSVDVSGNDGATVIDLSSLTTVNGSVDLDLSPDATVDASALGPGGGTVHVIGDDGRATTVILGSLAQMQGTLTITTADGVTLTSATGLATITLTGTAAGNTLIGSATAENVIAAGAGNDVATGGNNDDLFTGGAGDDALDGRGGIDTAIYSGNFADYSIVRHADGSLTIADTRSGSPDGADTLSNFELFQFADGVRSLAGVLPAPTITSNGGGDNGQVAIDENTTAVTLVAASNPNAVQSLEFSIAGGADAGKFQIDKTTGALSFVAAPDFEHAADIGGNNVYDVIVAVSDGFRSDTQALAVGVGNVNEAPDVLPLLRSVGEDGPSFTQALLTGANDPDAGTQLTVSNLDATVTTSAGRTLALGVDYTLTDSTLSLTALGFAKFNELGRAQTDQAVFHFGVSDGLVTIANALTLTVAGANDAPTLADQTADQSTTAGTPFSLILPSDTFHDVDNGDMLTLAAALSNGDALPAWLSFNAATGAFSGTPGAGDGGSFDIKVTATDKGGLSAADVFHLTVAAPTTNHAPVIASDLGGATASVIITDDTRYVTTVHASDPDPGTQITYAIVGGADQKLFAIDARTGVLTFKQAPQDGHAYNVAVAASDGSLQDTQAIKVQVAHGPFAFGNTGVADTFTFNPHFGLSVVSNFDATSAVHDVLELDHALFRNADPNASPSAILDLIQHHTLQVGHDAVILTDTFDVIDLKNANVHNLTANDFILV